MSFFFIIPSVGGGTQLSYGLWAEEERLKRHSRNKDSTQIQT